VNENKYPLISLPSDPRIRALRDLQTPNGRSNTGKYLIEGIRHVARACEEQVQIDLLFVDPSALSNPFGQKLVRHIRQNGVPAIRLAPKVYREITRASEPQGIGAVLRQRWFSVDELRPERNSLWLAVESVDQPGNLGTIIRTAEAAGASGIFLLGQGADPLDPACLRATMGAFFSQKLVPCSTWEFARWARLHNVAIVGSSPQGLMNYRDFRCRWPAVLLVGSERQGLSQQLIDTTDFVVRIPMHGRSDSINAAVAAGILLFELSSRRKRDK